VTPTVLFVDDDQSLLEGIRRALRGEPYEIAVAGDARAALEIIKTKKIAVVVADEHMPFMQGSDFLAAAAAHYPAMVRILFTGRPDLETAIKAINQGQIYRFLTKPCPAEEMKLCLRQALQHRALMVQAARLLAAFRRQQRALAELERQNPGISKVARDASGAVMVDDMPVSLDELLRNIAASIGAPPEE